MKMDIIKGNQLEMKNTLCDMTGTLIGINKVNKGEDQKTYRENGETKNT